MAFALVLMSLVAFGQVDLEKLRVDFYKAVESSDKADELGAQLPELSKSESPVVKGYVASYGFLLAKHVYNPYTKYKHFNEGKAGLEGVIKQYPNEPELRFIRLSIQAHLPDFLGYAGDVKKDKDFLIKSLPNLGTSSSDVQLRRSIAGFLKDAKCCTAAEKAYALKFL